RKLYWRVERGRGIRSGKGGNKKRDFGGDVLLGLKQEGAARLSSHRPADLKFDAPRRPIVGMTRGRAGGDANESEQSADIIRAELDHLLRVTRCLLGSQTHQCFACDASSSLATPVAC